MIDRDPSDHRPFLVLTPRPRSHLVGPHEAESPVSRPVSGLVTGGGLVAVMDSARGLQALWRGEEPLFLGLSLQLDGSDLLPHPPFSWGKGSWIGRYRVDPNLTLVERALLPDDPPGLVLQWSLGGYRDKRAPPTLTVRLLGRDSKSLYDCVIQMTYEHPATVCIIPDEADPSRTEMLILGLRERERLRERRADPPFQPLEISIDGRTVDELQAAIDILTEAGLEGPPNTRPPDPEARELFLRGLSADGPSYLSGAELVELGLGALAAGLQGLGRRALEAAARDSSTPPLAILYLAAQYALWSGDPNLLTRLMPTLAKAGGALETGARVPTLPTPSETLRLVLDALEPLGEDPCTESLGRELQRLDRATAGLGRSLPTVRSRTVGDVGPSPDGTESDPAAVRLEPVAAFEHPYFSGVAPARTVHSSRLIRAWVEGQLGLRADGAFGRLRLAPRLQPEWGRMTVRGLRIGDARIDLSYQRNDDLFDLELNQQTGRFPCNVVFAPLLPIAEIERIEIGGARADVRSWPEGEGVRIECQFPLDPGRSIRVVARRTR